MVEAILWDNDGVLVDTECLFFESTRTILDTIGIQLSLRQFLDLSMREGRSTFELAIERGWGRQQVAELKRERDLLYSGGHRHFAASGGRSRRLGRIIVNSFPVRPTAEDGCTER